MLKTIPQGDLLHELMNLQEGHILYTDVDIEVANRIQHVNTQIESCENLFTSYINKTTEKFDTFNLQRFIDEFTSFRVLKNDLITKEYTEKLGSVAYNYIIDNGLESYLDFRVNKIAIKRRGVIKCERA
jgi:hypothetical protein